jgi:peptidoglycan/xylan/chitin deacetylase (PgdA/CDA1 family)/GT2 family glycosyltransferase
VPTHERRDLVVRLVRLLDDQEYADFEAIVVVDGSSDGTTDALRALEPRFPLIVLEQPQAGPAAARNAGAAAATGEILLFLDDDMAPDRALLAAHDRSHREGAQLVLGHLPLDPASPPTAMAAVVGRWAERRRERLSARPGHVPVPDLISGQMSVARGDFERLGGFDVGLRQGEDRDFGSRARKAGLRVVFDPGAVSRQYYDVDAGEYLRRTRAAARGDSIVAARHPELAHELWQPRFEGLLDRLLLGPLVVLPQALSRPVVSLAARLFSGADQGRWRNRFFFATATMEHRRGAREERKALAAPLAVVLAYHSLSDLTGDRILAEYGIPPERLAAQLDRLIAAGWRFVDVDQLLAALDGGGPLPDRAVLLTFDDAYADLDRALPVLAERKVPAIAFAVADRIGGTNDWRRSDETELRLLDAEQLRQLSAHGIAVGSHGSTHRPLVGLTPDQLQRELVDSADRIAALGLPRPAVLSYPYGEWSPDVADAAERAGYRAAFTVAPGAVRRSQRRHALPRIEVLASQSDRTLPLRLALRRRR